MKKPQLGSALLLLLLYTSRCHGAESRETFSITKAKRLQGATYRIEKAPLLSICTQLCASEAWKCISINYDSVTHVCELNSHSSTQPYSPLLSDASDAWSYSAKTPQNSDGDCELGSGNDQCHPQWTVKCTPSYTTQLGSPMKRVCQCKPWAQGDLCNQLRKCTEEEMCFEAQTAVKSQAEAEQMCEGLGGWLATPGSAEQQTHLQLVLEQEGILGDTHIGVSYHGTTHRWTFLANLQPVTGWTNWAADSTHDDDVNRKGCAQLVDGGDGKVWTDSDCSVELPYICQVPSCPTDFRAENGSCYNFVSSTTDWATQYARCRHHHPWSYLAHVTNAEEDSYIRAILQSEFGTGYAFSMGLNDWHTYQTFRWSHNDWIMLDWNNKHKHLGCFQDGNPRAMTVIEGTHSMISDNYQSRSDAITKCFYICRWHNFKMYSVQNGGHCNCDADAHLNYDRHGTATNCADGKGGPMTNDVYLIYNHNLFEDFAFDAGWNGGERVFYWWHGDAWRWHDAGYTGGRRAVCKVEHCPPGFVPFANKCFKLITTPQTWSDALDSCHLYTGAELFHPEYADEAEFLESRLLPTSGPYWTGVHDEDGSADALIYRAQGKLFSDNYNVYRMGGNPIWRNVIDGATSGTDVDLRFTFPEDGKIVAWEYFATTSGRTVFFQVVRKMGIDCTFKLIGQNQVTTGSEFQRVEVPEADQIIAKKGDYVSFTYLSGAAIRFNNEGGGYNLCKSHNTMITTVGEEYFLENNSHDRVFSFRALWRPLDHQGEPIDWSDAETNNDGGSCFKSSFNRALVGGMALYDEDCATQLPSVCEIKKYERMAPVR